MAGLPTPLGRRDVALALALFCVAATVYLASPKRDLSDPKYALLTSESLLARRSWDLLPYLPTLRGLVRDEHRVRSLPWQLRAVEGRLVYLYPPGTPLFSTVPLALFRLAGESTLDERGHYSARDEKRLQAKIAALLSAGAVLLAYALARRELSPGRAFAVALVAAFGTGYWSVASRVLWSHTWTVVFVSAALLEWLRWEEGRPPRPVLLGALLAAAFWARPTSAIVALAFTVATALRHRAALPRLVAAGAAGALLYLLYAQLVWSAWLPAYARFAPPSFRVHPLQALAGQLVSPQHGLLVFSPILLAVVWTLARRGVAPARRSTAIVALAVVASYLLYHAGRTRWWGFGAVGPRFLCDLTPFLAWLGAHAWRRADEHPADNAPRRAWGRLAVAALALASVAAHATGPLEMPLRAGHGKAARTKLERVEPEPVELAPVDELGAVENPRRWRQPDWSWQLLPQLKTARYLGRLFEERDRPARPRPARRGRSRPDAP